MSAGPQPNIKDTLNSAIRAVCSRIADFAENPAVDFTRSRKLPAYALIQFTLNMEGNSLNAEIYNNFPDLKGRMTASAFEQQRDKLKPDAFLALLHAFNASFTDTKTLHGLRVYGIDGSDFCTPRNKDSKWYIPNHAGLKADGSESKGVCQLHGNFLYDLLNKQYMDFIEMRDEREAAIKLIAGIKDPSHSLVIMDRGYSGFNMIEHCNRYGGYYVIRNPLTSTIKEIAGLPDAPCDLDFEIKVSTRSMNWCNLYGYRKLNVHKDRKAEYSEKTIATQWDFEDKCVVKFRAVKFRINDSGSGKDVWEVLITNLPRERYSLAAMKHIYHMRWGIETSFLELKYALGAINFHSKKDKFILQELYAHLIMFNATSRVAARIPIKHSDKGWAYAVDFKMVVHVFRNYFRPFSKAPPDDMYADMTRYRHMVRNGRHNMRLLKPKSAVYFVYRVA